MLIEIRCHKCGKVLEIKDTFSQATGEMIIRVFPCSNIDCYDCGACEIPKQILDLKEFSVHKPGCPALIAKNINPSIIKELCSCGYSKLII